MPHGRGDGLECHAGLLQWFDDVNETLDMSRQWVMAPKTSLEAVEAGKVDFGAMVEETRHKMQTSFEKGHTLGNSGKTAQPKARRTTKK